MDGDRRTGGRLQCAFVCVVGARLRGPTEQGSTFRGGTRDQSSGIHWPLGGVEPTRPEWGLIVSYLQKHEMKLFVRGSREQSVNHCVVGLGQILAW